jgi:hypothetical protein
MIAKLIEMVESFIRTLVVVAVVWAVFVFIFVICNPIAWIGACVIKYLFFSN